MLKKLIQFSTCLGFMGCMTLSSQATPVHVTGGVLNAVETDASVVALQGSLTTELQQIGSQINASNQALQATMSQLMNTLDSRMVVQKVQQAGLDATKSAETGASGCNVISGNIGTGSFGATIAKWREQMSQQTLDDLSGNSTTTPSHLGKTIGENARVALHCSYFAVQAEVDQGICPKKTVANSSYTGQSTSTIGDDTANKAGADLEASVILNAQNDVLSKDGLKAAQIFQMHAFEDNPLGALPPAGTVSSAAAQALAAKRFTNLAHRNVATQEIQNLITNRTDITNDSSSGQYGSLGATTSATPSANSGTSSTSSSSSSDLLDWANATAQQVIGMRVDSNNKYYPNGISKDGYEELRAKAWFWNLDWMGNINSENEAQLLKELAMMQSFQVYQNWETMQEIKLTNLILSTMLDDMEADKVGTDTASEN